MFPKRLVLLLSLMTCAAVFHTVITLRTISDVSRSLEDIESIRISLGLYDPDPVVDADRTQHAALLTFGNDQYDRWTALPAGLKFSDVSETFRRIVGTTERQRFETRITSSAELVSTQQSESENSCCTKVSQNSIRP